MAPALAAASSSTCDATVDAFYACATTNGQGVAACNGCLAGYLPESGQIGSCAESELYTCYAMDACPECGNCTTETVAWANCLNQGQCHPITCSAAAPASPPTPAPSSRGGSAAPAVALSVSAACQDTAGAFAACASASEGGNVAACLRCLTNYVPANTTTTCQEVEMYTCSSTDACSECGNCEAEIVAIVDCAGRGLCDPINCNAEAPPVAAPTSTAPSSAGASGLCRRRRRRRLLATVLAVAVVAANVLVAAGTSLV